MRVKVGDILLVGTDGLWDNVYEKDIIRIVNE